MLKDALLGIFFEPFIFEALPALNYSAQSVYLKEVERSDIYLGLFGKEYGREDSEGISATEREFDHASFHHKTRLVYVSQHKNIERHPKEIALIKKAENVVVRKYFNSIYELKTSVYISLVRYLKEQEYIRTGPFDASSNAMATLDDLDFEKIYDFVACAKVKRGFPLPAEADAKTVLIHLNLLGNTDVSNAAILLFGKRPQRFFISSEVKCVQFYGNEIVKPIPSYQVYKGNVFQLVNQAVDFVMSKIDVSVGTRDRSAQVPIEPEIPVAAVTEAIVNAVAHRDYTSNASIQVMLFKNRLEIWNPGTLPFGLSTAKLREPHPSIPNNPLLAEPMYLAGYIERIGTGTRDIIHLCKKAGLQEPEFIQEEIFKTIIWRKKVSDYDSENITLEELYHQSSAEIKNLLIVIEGEMTRQDIQRKLELKHEGNFRVNYLLPGLQLGLIEMTIPEKPKSCKQKYRLTSNGLALKLKKAIWDTTVEVPQKYSRSTVEVQHPLFSKDKKITDDKFPIEVQNKHRRSTEQVPDNYHRSSIEMKNFLLSIEGEMTRQDIQRKLGLKNGGSFRINYLVPALQSGLIEMTIPEKPTSYKQKYRLTSKGLELKKTI